MLAYGRVRLSKVVAVAAAVDVPGAGKCAGMRKSACGIIVSRRDDGSSSSSCELSWEEINVINNKNNVPSSQPLLVVCTPSSGTVRHQPIMICAYRCHAALSTGRTL